MRRSAGKREAQVSAQPFPYDLPISLLAANSIRNAGVGSLEELAGHTVAALLRLPGITRRTLREIVELLKQHDLTLAGPPAFPPEPPPDPIDAAFGRAVQHRREAKDFTTAELAAAIGVSAHQIRKIERGRAQLSVSTLTKLAKTLGISVEALIKSDHQRVPGANVHDHPNVSIQSSSSA